MEDSGFAIDEFGGWPGPMVKQALDAFGPAGLVHLAALTARRTCRFASAAVYADADGGLHVFADDTRKPGTVATAPDHGHGPRSWSDLWSVFVPDGESAPLAALPRDRRQRIFAEWRETSVLAALGAWLHQRQVGHGGPPGPLGGPE